MTNEHEGVSPASAGGAPAPDFNAIRDAVIDSFRAVPLWQFRQGLVTAGLIPADVEITAANRKPVHSEPGIDADWDEDANAMLVHGVGWDLSWGCKVSFAYDHDKGEHYVCVSTSDADQRAGITTRRATKEQLASLGQQLLNVFGEPDPRDAAGLVDVCNALHTKLGHLPGDCYEASVSHALGLVRELAGKVKLRDLTIKAMHEVAKPFSLSDQRDAEIERLRAQVDELAKIRVALFGEVRQALTERDEAREEWKRADAEVTRLKRLVGNENVSYDGWDQLSRHDAIVRCEEGWQEDLKARDERDRLRQQLDQHLADETSAQAANDRLRNEIQNHNAGHDGTMRYITNRLSDILDANTADIHELLNMVSLRVEGGDEASAELKRRELRRTFQPGQRVRIGLCNGIVVQPKDVTRVQLEGTLYDVDYPTRVVEPILNDDGEMPF